MLLSWWHRTTPPTPAPKPLEEAVSDAHLLLAYAARRGLEIQPVTAQSIIAMGTHDQPSADAEQRFWIALSELSRLIRPATIERVRAYLPQPRAQGPGFDPSPADTAVRRYRQYAYRALAVLLVVQIYTLVGSAVLKDINTPNPEMDDVAKRFSKEQQALSTGTPAPSMDDFYEVSRLQANLTKQLNHLTAMNMLLDGWQRYWHPVELFDSIRPAPPAANAAALFPSDRVPPSIPPPDRRATEPYSAEHELTVIEGGLVLSALQAYVLPFLYGMLGACVFILRSLANDIQHFEFSSEIGYRLRMPLGALAGVAVAWLPSSEPLTGATPLALAFLAGYSVEILFNAMDRLIKSLSGDAKPAPSEVQKAAA